MITIDSFRKGYLRRRIAAAQAEGDVYRRNILMSVLTEMEIPVDSEVGTFVMADFRPSVDPSGEEPAYTVESVFEFLTLLTRDDKPAKELL